MGNHNELGLLSICFQELGKTVDIGFIQRGIDFIQDHKRCRLVSQEGEKQGDDGEGPFSSGKQGKIPHLFPRRLDFDLDARFQDMVFILDPEPGPASSEQLFITVSEIPVDLAEGFPEPAGHICIDTADYGFQLGFGLGHIFILALQEVVSFPSRLVFFFGRLVHRSQLRQFLGGLGFPSFQFPLRQFSGQSFLPSRFLGKSIGFHQLLPAVFGFRRLFHLFHLTVVETLLDAGFLSLQDDSLLGQLLPFGQERFLFLEELLPRPLGSSQFLLQGCELFSQSCQVLFTFLDLRFLLPGFLFSLGDLQLGLLPQLIDGLDPGVQGFQLALSRIDGNQGILMPPGGRLQLGPLFHQPVTEGLGRFFPFQVSIFQLLHFRGQFLYLCLERQEPLCSLPLLL